MKEPNWIYQTNPNVSDIRNENNVVCIDPIIWEQLEKTLKASKKKRYEWEYISKICIQYNETQISKRKYAG
jgi:hypothetical protein